MTRGRPPALLVMAILNFVFGGLTLIWLTCAGAGLGVALAMSKSMPGPPGQPNPFKEMGEVYDRIPGFWTYTIASMTLGLVMAILLIVAGVGLLRVRPWGRGLCLLYSVYTILAGLAGMAYTLGVANPVMHEWAEDFNRRMDAAGMPGAQQDPTLNNILSVIVSVIEIAYAIALLIVMFLPSVRAAFAGKYRGPWDDLYDSPERARESAEEPDVEDAIRPDRREEAP